MAKFTDSKKKERYSIAYLTAIAAKAGVTLNFNDDDSESQDATLSLQTIDKDDNDFTSDLNIQLKSTSSMTEYQICSDKIKYNLKVKNYNDLISKRSTEIILALLIIPDFFNCLKWSVENLILKSTMYWVSLKDHKTTTNKSKIMVSFPINQKLNSKSLVEIMKKIARNEQL